MDSVIGMWLREQRKERQLTQKKAAELRGGLSASEIGQIERGECFPSKRYISKYVRVLGIEQKEFETMWVEHLKELNKTRSNVLGEYLQGQREILRINRQDMVKRVPSFSTADIRRVEEGDRQLTVVELMWFALALELSDMPRLLDMRRFDEVRRATLYFEEYAKFGGSSVAEKALEILKKA